MKSIGILLIFAVWIFSCKKDDMFRSETDERFSMLKEEITNAPEIPISFYWESSSATDSIKTPPVASCLTTEVRFEKPYIIANGVKFHAYYWSRTQNKLVGPKLHMESMFMVFNQKN